MVSDRVGDFIIRLKNAAAIGTRQVSAPYSNHLFSISQKLKALGFLTRVETSKPAEEASSSGRTLLVELAYTPEGEPKLRGVKRISSPGRRLYAPHTALHRVKGGTGASVISSSTGIISDTEARKRKVGGETLFEIW